MSPSEAVHACVRCGRPVHRPRSACRDCHTSDPAIVARLIA